MSTKQESTLEKLVTLVKTSTTAQASIAAACVVAGTAAFFLAPHLKIGYSVVKGEILSVLYGTPEQRLLAYVLQTAKKGDPQSVLDRIDEYCWAHQWMMNVGNIKGKILDQAVIDRKPMIAIELGGYCGYSAVRIGRLLPTGAKFYTIEANPKFAAIARQMIEFAGLDQVCTIIEGTSTETLPKLRDIIDGLKTVDLFFIDHVKSAYLADMKTIEQLGYLTSGSVVVADNVIFPGAPDYLVHVRANPNYQSTFNASTVEYSEIPDGVEVTIVK